MNSISDTGPVPEGMIRIAVRFGRKVYTVHFDFDRLEELLDQFEDERGDAIRMAWGGGVEGVRGLAALAASEGWQDALAIVAMWRFLNRPAQGDDWYEHPTELLAERIEEDGAASLIASTDDGTEWTFVLMNAEPSNFRSMLEGASVH